MIELCTIHSIPSVVNQLEGCPRRLGVVKKLTLFGGSSRIALCLMYNVPRCMTEYTNTMISKPYPPPVISDGRFFIAWQLANATSDPDCRVVPSHKSWLMDGFDLTTGSFEHHNDLNMGYELVIRALELVFDGIPPSSVEREFSKIKQWRELVVSQEGSAIRLIDENGRFNPCFAGEWDRLPRNALSSDALSDLEETTA